MPNLIYTYAYSQQYNPSAPVIEVVDVYLATLIIGTHTMSAVRVVTAIEEAEAIVRPAGGTLWVNRQKNYYLPLKLPGKAVLARHFKGISTN